MPRIAVLQVCRFLLSCEFLYGNISNLVIKLKCFSVILITVLRCSAAQL